MSTTWIPNEENTLSLLWYSCHNSEIQKCLGHKRQGKTKKQLQIGEACGGGRGEVGGGGENNN